MKNKPLRRFVLVTRLIIILSAVIQLALSQVVINDLFRIRILEVGAIYFFMIISGFVALFAAIRFNDQLLYKILTIVMSLVVAAFAITLGMMLINDVTDTAQVISSVIVTFVCVAQNIVGAIFSFIAILWQKKDKKRLLSLKNNTIY